MHPDARKNMRSKIQKLLASIQMRGGFLAAMDWSILSSHKFPEYIDEQDVYVLVWNQVMTAATVEGVVGDGPITGLFSADAFRRIEDGILEVVDALPMTYLVRMHFPSVFINLDAPVKVDDISLEAKSNFMGMPPLLGEPPPHLDEGCELTFTVTGYLNGKESYGYQLAMSRLLVIIHFLQQENIFGSFEYLATLKPNPRHGFLRSLENMPRMNLEFSTDLMGAGGIIEFGKDLGERFYRVTEGDNAVFSAEEHAKRALEIVVNLEKSSLPQAARISSAAEWCIRSQLSSERSFMQLQTCFGLESLFGSQDVNKITETIADRMAYVLADKLESRPTISKEFRALYADRSKLVHGHNTRLTKAEAGRAAWGRHMLCEGIKREIAKL